MTKSINTFLETLLFLLLFALAVTLSVGHNFNSAVIDGINLWIACVLPALFPYFIITAILSSLSVTGKISKKLTPFTRKIFGVGGSVGYALFISVISGYPVGAKTVADLKDGGLISDTESVRAAALCSTSSPVFLISSVGGIMFNSAIFGVALFITHLLSALLVGIIFSFYKRKDRPSQTDFPISTNKLDNILYQSVYSSVISVLVVGGLITAFYLLTEVLLYYGFLTPLITLLTTITGSENIGAGITLGIFECTKGLKALSVGGITALSLPIAASVCGFGGLSVIAQSIAYLKKAKIKTAPFLFAKVLSAVLNFIVGLIISLLIL